MHITLLRHATLLVELGGKQLLVDPMLSPKAAMDPVQNAANAWRIPMTDLPLSEAERHQLLDTVDAVLVTHTHRDHWDAAAQKMIPKDKLVLCQPEDEGLIKSQGFTQVVAVKDTYRWGKISICRTGGQHGTGEIGKKMGPVSGFILQAQGHTLYLAGDTIWCPEVREALLQYRPDTVVVNAGAAQFLQGDPITMTGEDVAQVLLTAPAVSVVAVHMDTVNHCHLTRANLNQYLAEQHLAARCLVPADGERIAL